MSTNDSKPATIMIIRHGEKPGSPEDDKNGGPDLSVQGSSRASALPILFLPASKNLGCSLKSETAKSETTAEFVASYSSSNVSGPTPRLPIPDYLFATADSSESKRPRQTISPTAAALGLTINHSFGNKGHDITALGQELRKATYANKTVLICWHHGTMEKLAEAIGATGATKWDGAVFDRVWCIDFSQGPAIQQFAQMLLFGDEPTVPKTPW